MRQSFARTLAGRALAVLGALLGGSIVQAEPASSSYRLLAHAVDAAGGTATSAGFRASASGGQGSSVGVSASATFLLQSGFWSLAGTGPVPIVLAVTRNPANEKHCDLNWSGNVPPYEVFASENCADPFVRPHGTTSANTWVDLAPPDGSLTCFNVRPLVAEPDRAAAPRPAPEASRAPGRPRGPSRGRAIR
jgi:hypothetical protein